MRDFDRAITAAQLIANEEYKGYALVGISEALIKAGQFDRAITVAQLITGEFTKGTALLDISEALIKAENLDKTKNFDKLIEFAQSFLYGERKNAALRSISAALVKRGNISKAFELATFIGDEELKRHAFQDIAKASTQPVLSLRQLLITTIENLCSRIFPNLQTKL